MLILTQIGHNIVEIQNMQVDLETAIIIGTQVGTAIGLGMMIKQIIKRLDVQNGRVSKLEDGEKEHLEKFHTVHE